MTVDDYIICPVCGSTECRSVWYSTDEEDEFCDKCGYKKTLYIKNNNKPYKELTETDWIFTQTLKPYGAFIIEYKHEKFCRVSGSLSNKKELVKLINKTNVSNIKSFTVSRFLRGKIVKYDIIRSLKLNKIKRKCSKMVTN